MSANDVRMTPIIMTPIRMTPIRVTPIRMTPLHYAECYSVRCHFVLCHSDECRDTTKILERILDLMVKKIPSKHFSINCRKRLMEKMLGWVVIHKYV